MRRLPLLGAVVIAVAWLAYGVATLSQHGATFDETSIFYAGDRTLFYFTHPGVPGALDFKAPGEPHGFSSRVVRWPDFADPWHYPVLPGLIEAVTNSFFGPALHSELDGHHLGLILLHAVGLFLFTLYACRFLGTRAGLMASAIYALYPSIVGYAFNNPKDLPATDFYSVAMLAAGSAFRNKRPRDLWMSAIFVGVSISSKLNGAFVFVTLLLWAAVAQQGPRRLSALKLWRPLCLFPAVGFGVFFALWPWLWHGNPTEWFGRIAEYVTFYARFAYSPRPGFTAFPFIALASMSPPLVLGLAALGGWKLFATHGDLHPWRWLITLWLALPLVRIAWPHSEFYDANRHFLEYIGALSVLAGVGGEVVWEVLGIGPKPTVLIAGATAGALLFLIWPLEEYRPYESAYFNSLVGGLGGAKRRALFYMQAPPHDAHASGSEGDFWNGSLRAALRFLVASTPAGVAVGFCGPSAANVVANLEAPPLFRLLGWGEPNVAYVYLMGRECSCHEADIRRMERERPVVYRLTRGGALIDEILGPKVGYPLPSVTARTLYADLPRSAGGQLIPPPRDEPQQGDLP